MSTPLARQGTYPQAPARSPGTRAGHRAAVQTAAAAGKLDQLRSRLSGRVITAADGDYDQARSVWNGAIDAHPAVIARCAGPGDVAAAAGFAQDAGLEISVRGGAHSFAGASVGEGGLTIDLSAMGQVRVDPQARTARVGGGATLAQLDAATQAHGLATPGGTVSHTGVGGLTLGGGFGWLTPQYGLSCDNLLSAQVVTADSEVLRASTEQHPDLFWALRGGGGNFGVVTEFEFRLHPVGPLAQLGLFFWDADDGQAALALAQQVTADLPPRMGALIFGGNAPPAPFIPPEHHFRPGVGLIVAAFGADAEHARLAGQIRSALPPLVEFITPIPYTGLQQILDESAPWGIQAYQKALYLDALSPAVNSIITAQLARRQSPEVAAAGHPAGRGLLPGARRGHRVRRLAGAVRRRRRRRLRIRARPAGRRPGLGPPAVGRPAAVFAGARRLRKLDGRLRSRPGASQLRSRQVPAAHPGQGRLRPRQRLPPQCQHQSRRIRPSPGRRAARESLPVATRDTTARHLQTATTLHVQTVRAD